MIRFYINYHTPQRELVSVSYQEIADSINDTKAHIPPDDHPAMKWNTFRDLRLMLMQIHSSAIIGIRRCLCAWIPRYRATVSITRRDATAILALIK